MIKYHPIILLAALAFSACGESQDTQTVKLSSSGICHDKSSSSYVRTKTFTGYKSINECIKAGGRLPKSKTNQIDLARKEAIDENRAFVTLYSRDEWPHWTDSDKDCQNTRHELLIASSSSTVGFKTAKECIVITGEWYDPYSGNTYNKSDELDLDHVVPLKFAHGHGGDKWSKIRKKAFANDPENLLLVNLSLNRQKGAKGLDEWLPPNLSYRCDYIAHFNKIMTKYNLEYIPSEKRTVNKMTKACAVTDN